MSEIVSYFEKLYIKRHRCSVGFEGLEWAPIKTESRSWLKRPFEEGEVRATIEMCDGEKAQGPDVYTMEVFKRGWNTIKKDVLGVFDEFFNNGIINACTNSTYICLIPKKLSSLKLKDYRPISFVTSLYKILAKVLSLRLRDVLGETISLAQ